MRTMETHNNLYKCRSTITSPATTIHKAYYKVRNADITKTLSIDAKRVVELTVLKQLLLSIRKLLIFMLSVVVLVRVVVLVVVVEYIIKDGAIVHSRPQKQYASSAPAGLGIVLLLDTAICPVLLPP